MIRTNKRMMSLCLLLLSLMLFQSCSDEKALPAPVGTISPVQKPLVEEKGIDILVPETETITNQDYLHADLFDLWDTFFKSFVAVVSETPFDTRVNFKSMHILRDQRDKDFIELVSAIEKKMTGMDLSGLTKETQMAFYINAYNYTGLRLINKGYLKDGKIIESIKDLSKVIIDTEILTRDVIPLKEGIISMDTILKKKLKDLVSANDKVKDARFMMALNGGMMSRSLILNEAYRPEKLEEQLDFINKAAFKLGRIAEIKGRKLHLTRIFKWYKDFFEDGAGSLENFAREAGMNPDSFDMIRYHDFNWSLNDLASFPGVVEDETGVIPPLPVRRDDEPKDDSATNEGESEPVDFGKPCDYLKSDSVTVLSYCDRVLQGELDGFYKYENDVTDATICVYTRKSEDGKDSLGAIGNVIEIPKDSGVKKSQSIEVEDRYKERKDKLSIWMAEGVRTKLEYLKTDKRLMVRQTSVIPGKGYRKFLLQCQ